MQIGQMGESIILIYSTMMSRCVLTYSPDTVSKECVMMNLCDVEARSRRERHVF